MELWRKESSTWKQRYVYKFLTFGELKVFFPPTYIKNKTGKSWKRKSKTQINTYFVTVTCPALSGTILV